MRKLQLLPALLFSILSFGQSNIWTKANDNFTSSEKKFRTNIPSKYQTFELNLTTLKTILATAPQRNASRISATIISLPDADGNLKSFSIFEAPIMEAGLAAKFPMIKSYVGQGIEDKSAVARFSVTTLGFHSMTLSRGSSTVFIDPLTFDQNFYMVYERSSLQNSMDFVCETGDQIDLPSIANDRNSSANRSDADDGLLRTYRLAQSCTAEYGNIFAGTGTLAQQKANIQSQMAVTMTRVNGVYELDFGITMIFVANNDLIIYLGDVNADPWSGEYNTKTAQTIDAQIGVNNYDIGHNFNTSGGGNAGCIGCVCKSISQSGTHKGRGETGRPNPTGDAFDIDYVAHEMGHQFGGYHTMSSSGCRSGSGLTEVEPGSASTIMGYAGICAANVQNNSDDYFAYVNLRDILAYVKTTTGSCSVNTATGNNAPTVSAGADYTIPKSTAFVLTATGSDPDGDTLFYNWEENDPGNPNSSAAPVATRVVGPMFRSKPSTLSPQRYFPAMATILTGATANTWEVVPSVTRPLNFSVVARDNIAMAGQFASDLSVVNVTAAAGPFLVTAPNTNVTWTAASNQTVTWDVAGTTANGVNTPFVDIYLSTNNSGTFPILLASKVPNNGSELVTIPNTAGNQNRIMVRGHDNVFLDVSNTNFTVAASAATFALAFDGNEGGQNKSVCQSQQTSFIVKYATFGGFSNTTNISVTGNPAGTTISLSASTVSATADIVVTVLTNSSVTPGIYQLVVNATSGATTKSANLYLDVQNGNFTTISAISPAANATNQPTTVTLNWTNDAAATSYNLVVATDLDFTNIIADETLAATNYVVSGLLINTNYFWKVKPKNSSCEGNFGDVIRFTTGSSSCANYSSSNVPIAISASGTPTINSTLAIPAIVDNISSVTVSVNISHTYTSDLTATLISPNGTQVILFTNQCGANDDVNATFSDSGTAIVCGGTPTINGTILPAQALSGLNDENPSGSWTLRIFDNANADGGALNSWSLNICTSNSNVLACGDISTTWDGSSWSNGFPVDNVSAIINGNLDLTRNLEACNLNIDNNSIMTVQSGINVLVQNEVTVGNGSNLLLENNSNLVQVTDVLNSGIAEVKRNSNPLMRLDYTMWSSPVSGLQTLKEFSPATLDNRFYNYDPSTNLFTVVASPDANAFNVGQGYLIRMPDNHPTTPTVWEGNFIGTLNNGAVAIQMQNSGAGFGYNLVGNPYPSTIDADTFLSENQTNINGTIYFWRKTNAASGTAYATYTVGGATTTSPTSPTPNGVIQVGQGFIVSAKSNANPTLQFSNSQRIANNENQFFRLPPNMSTIAMLERKRVWLNLTNDNGFFAQSMIGFLDTADDAVDAFDGKYIGDSSTYFASDIDGQDFAVQLKALPFDDNAVFPMNFASSAVGNFSIAIDHIDDNFLGQQIFLIDNQTQTLHDLTTAYNFATLSGTFPSRFEIVFRDPDLKTTAYNIENSVVVAASDKISIRSQIEKIVAVSITDLLGRKIYEQKSVGKNTLTIDDFQKQKQALVVKIVLESGIVVYKKIVF